MKKHMGLNTSVHCGILQKYLCQNRQINQLKGVLNIKTSCTSLVGRLDQVTIVIIFSEKIKKDIQCVSVSILRIFCLRGSAVSRRLTRQITFEVPRNYLQLSLNIINHGFLFSGCPKSMGAFKSFWTESLRLTKFVNCIRKTVPTLSDHDKRSRVIRKAPHS